MCYAPDESQDYQEVEERLLKQQDDWELAIGSVILAIGAGLIILAIVAMF